MCAFCTNFGLFSIVISFLIDSFDLLRQKSLFFFGAEKLYNPPFNMVL